MEESSAKTKTLDVKLTEPEPEIPFKIVACPWCGIKWAKNEACNWVCCGLLENKQFLVD